MDPSLHPSIPSLVALAILALAQPVGVAAVSLRAAGLVPAAGLGLGAVALLAAAAGLALAAVALGAALLLRAAVCGEREREKGGGEVSAKLAFSRKMRELIIAWRVWEIPRVK